MIERCQWAWLKCYTVSSLDPLRVDFNFELFCSCLLPYPWWRIILRHSGTYSRLCLASSTKTRVRKTQWKQTPPTISSLHCILVQSQRKGAKTFSLPHSKFVVHSFRFFFLNFSEFVFFQKRYVQTGSPTRWWASCQIGSVVLRWNKNNSKNFKTFRISNIFLIRNVRKMNNCFFSENHAKYEDSPAKLIEDVLTTIERDHKVITLFYRFLISRTWKELRFHRTPFRKNRLFLNFMVISRKIA